MVNKLLILLFRLVLKLRYRIEVRGLKELSLNPDQGTLFLPNHPSEIESIILITLLWEKYKIRPLAVEYIFLHPIFGAMARSFNCFPVPNFDTAVSQYKIKRAKKIFAEAIDELRKGVSLLLYPAGACKNTGKEVIGGASAAHSFVQEYPEANVVLVRITGLWGSSFSRAISGRTPDMTEVCLHALKTLLKNLFFFSPRRDILIEFEANPPELPRNSSRVEFNHFIEDWYNHYPDKEGNRQPEEPPTLISYSIWKSETLKLYQRKKSQMESTGAVTPELFEKVAAEIRRIVKNPSHPIEPNMYLAFDLAMDSMDIGDLSAFLIKTFNVQKLKPELLETVQDVLEIAAGARPTEAPEPLDPSLHWPKESGRPPPSVPLGKTLPEAFLHACKKIGNRPLCADDFSGVLTYPKAKKAIYVLAEKFRTYPEDSVAVMLPASSAAFLVILALQFAGKIPVMLNWTLGPRYLEEMMSLSGAKRVVTSFRFLDRVSHVDFGNLDEKMELLETIRSDLSLGMKLKGVFRSKISALPSIDPEQTCIILFTSGTESSPKGVPLSHKNVLTMIQEAIDALQPVHPSDTVLSVLPPFHSFGFAAVGMLSFVSGARIVFYSDPTDGPAIGERLVRWNATIFPAPPSFIKRLISGAKEEQIKSIRLYISGAEKAPEELLGRLREINPDVLFLEGYGITECASTVSVNRAGKELKGVGKLLPLYEVRTIHPETLEPLPEGADGELCLFGSSVFKGYLGKADSPFIEIDGKQWYRTGDLGHIDSERYVYLSGRFKRFAKVGGEMISLGAIEETLVRELISQNRISPDTPSLAICSQEKEGDTYIILFITIPLEKDDANEILKNGGFSNLIKISDVKQIDAIPVLATGKTNYRSLQDQIT